MTRSAPRLLALEDRLAPAIATWDGGGADNKWMTAANWVGDVAPNPGDDLVFPAGVAQRASMNDFPTLTDFGQIALNGANYQITGNRIILTNGITSIAQSDPGSPPVLAIDLNLNNPQTFTGGSYVLSGLIGPNFFGNLNIVTPAGTVVTLSGSIQGPGGIDKTGSGTLYVTGPNETHSGGVGVEEGIGFVNGTEGSSFGGGAGAGGTGVASGVGVVGFLTAGNGGTVTPGDGQPTTDPIGHTLTAYSLRIASSFSGSAAGVMSIFIRSFQGDSAGNHDELVVSNGVQLGGFLRLRTANGSSLGDGTITIINNTDSFRVDETFAGLPEGAVINNVGGKAVRISYRGGDGNDVTLTTVSPAIVPRFAVGAGAGGGPQVNVYAVANGNIAADVTYSPVLLRAFNAYDPRFRGGVRVATGDITGDGVIDIVTAPGAGGGPDVRVWDGATGALVQEFNAYDPSFHGGVFVALGDINGDGTPDIVTGAGAGGGPHVKVFSGRDGTVLASLFAYDPSFKGGVTVAAGNLFGSLTNRAVVITGAGPGGGPHVKVFDLGFTGTLLRGFFAFDPNFRGGVTVATGDTDGDGNPDIIVGAGGGGLPLVRAFNGITNAPQLDFLAYNSAFTGGVTVAAIRLTSSADTIITGAGPGGGPHVNAFNAPGLSFFAFDPAFLGGVFVG